jgi:hypothetical protein
VNARRVGLGREEFWDLAPIELAREMEAARLRQQDEADRVIALAWHIEALRRTKKLPALRTLLKETAQRPQTLAQQKAVIHILSAQMGIPLRKVSRRG